MKAKRIQILNRTPRILSNCGSFYGKHRQMKPNMTKASKSCHPNSRRSWWRTSRSWAKRRVERTFRLCPSQSLKSSHRVSHGRCRPRKTTWCWQPKKRRKRGLKSLPWTSASRTCIRRDWDSSKQPRVKRRPRATITPSRWPVLTADKSNQSTRFWMWKRTSRQTTSICRPKIHTIMPTVFLIVL